MAALCSKRLTRTNLKKEDEAFVSFRFGDNKARDSLNLADPSIWNFNDLLSGLVNRVVLGKWDGIEKGL